METFVSGRGFLLCGSLDRRLVGCFFPGVTVTDNNPVAQVGPTSWFLVFMKLRPGNSKSSYAFSRKNPSDHGHFWLTWPFCCFFLHFAVNKIAKTALVALDCWIQDWLLVWIVFPKVAKSMNYDLRVLILAQPRVGSEGHATKSSSC